MRAHIRIAGTAAVAAMALLGAACGGGSATGAGAPKTPTSEAGTGGNASPDGGAGQQAGSIAPASGRIPDPCTLLSNDEIAAIIGSDPGAGTKTQTVDSRAVCSYEDGGKFIVGISDGDQYGTMADRALEKGGTEIAGVGDNAVYQVVYGAVAQLIAVQAGMAVDISMPLGDDHDGAKNRIIALVNAYFSKLA